MTYYKEDLWWLTPDDPEYSTLINYTGNKILIIVRKRKNKIYTTGRERIKTARKFHTNILCREHNTTNINNYLKGTIL